jgi:DNA-binding CsgD family transcriptional regulator
MYEVINPAFVHLAALTSWYWAVPYIAALCIMGNLPTGIKHANMLYAGMTMMVGAFLGFMLLGRNTVDYLVVDTLMLAACGVFDLFWWSILGEMLDYTENPSTVLGMGLSANVLGVLCGGVIGMVATTAQRLSAEITVIALTVVCITLVILPLLNRHLVLLLKSHAYLTAYAIMGENQQTAILYNKEALDPLTGREQEVLQLILSGKSNREIAESLHITENTVKTHVRNIYSKYAVRSRAELISNLFKGKTL